MGGYKVKGSRVDYGASVSGKDRRTGSNSQPAGVSSATNAKKSISKTENQNTSTEKAAQPVARKIPSAS